MSPPPCFGKALEWVLAGWFVGGGEAMSESAKWLEECRLRGMALGLEGTSEMLIRLGNPELLTPTIQVAGSNGKGTACALLSGTLILSEYCVGTFTSPHVVKIEERFRIDGEIVSTPALEKAILMIKRAAEGQYYTWSDRQFAETSQSLQGENKRKLNPTTGPNDEESPKPEELKPTFFEATYLAAMVLFAEKGVDVGVIETGLGGRLDATSTCKPFACLITSLSLEHSDILGDSIVKVAIEKAGIAQEGCPLILRNNTPEVEEAVRQSIPSPELLTIENIPANTSYRQEAKLLAAALLAETDFASAVASLDEACEKVRWPARMQLVNSKVGLFETEVILDAAHNPSGISKMLTEFGQIIGERSWALLIGSSPQDDIIEFLMPFSELCKAKGLPLLVVVSEPQTGRYPPIPHEDLAKEIRDLLPPGIPITGSPNPLDAWTTFNAALAAAGGGEAVLGLSTGSLYLQGDILESSKLANSSKFSLFPSSSQDE